MQQQYFYPWMIPKSFSPHFKLPNGGGNGYHMDACCLQPGIAIIEILGKGGCGGVIVRGNFEMITRKKGNQNTKTKQLFHP